MAEKKLIDLYPYRFTDDHPEFLLLKRSKGRIYQGQWRMIGGKVEEGEAYWQAALRELDEETGLIPLKFWTLPSINQFYEAKTDQILSIPAFAAEIAPDKTPELDSEHSEAEWLHIEDAVKVIAWPEQQRLLRLLFNLLTSNQILDDWLVHTY
jgi:dihydroneopterin triphosphate diphosphatase